MSRKSMIRSWRRSGRSLEKTQIKEQSTFIPSHNATKRKHRVNIYILKMLNMHSPSYVVWSDDWTYLKIFSAKNKWNGTEISLISLLWALMTHLATYSLSSTGMRFWNRMLGLVHKSVLTMNGYTHVVLILLPLSVLISILSDSISPRTAYFVEQYRARFFTPVRPAEEQRATMWPLLLFLMVGRNASIVWNVLKIKQRRLYNKLQVWDFHQT